MEERKERRTGQKNRWEISHEVVVESELIRPSWKVGGGEGTPQTWRHLASAHGRPLKIHHHAVEPLKVRPRRCDHRSRLRPVLTPPRRVVSHRSRARGVSLEPCGLGLRNLRHLYRREAGSGAAASGGGGCGGGGGFS